MPHSLRISILLLRVALGLSFLYLGWSTLFNTTLATTLRGHSLGSLYGWLTTPAPFASIPSAVFAWIFLFAGILLILGLFTRIVSIVAIVVVLAAWLPAISFANFNPAQFVNDELLAICGLLILVFGKAGTYVGIDKFLRWSKRFKE